MGASRKSHGWNQRWIRTITRTHEPYKRYVNNGISYIIIQSSFGIILSDCTSEKNFTKLEIILLFLLFVLNFKSIYELFYVSQARNGLESSVDVLKLSLAFLNESTTSQFVWRDLVGNIDRVGLLVSERANYTLESANLSRFVRNLLAPTLAKLGYTPRPGERMSDI